MSRVVASLTVCLAAAGLVACGDDDSGPSDPASRPEMIVFGAASLEPAFEQYAERFEDADIKYSFAGSDDLAAQIRQGVKPDVFASANTTYPDELYDEGLAGKPITFATNTLVLAVPAGSDITSVDDLAEPGTTIAMGDPEVPIGDYTRQILAGLGEEESQAILDNVASSEPDVSGIVGKLTQGAVDAGFVYISDVVAAGDALEAIQLPKDLQPEVAYGVTIVDGASEPELAEQFISGLLDGFGADALGENGFGPPPKG